MRAAVVLGVLLLAALIGGGAALIIRAQTDDSATELRLSARRLDDGSVELGLQRRVEGGWGARILPDGRFLSLNVPNNEWRNSAAFALAESGPEEAEPVAPPAADQSEPVQEAAQADPAEAEEAASEQEQAAADDEQAADNNGGEAAAETGGEEDAQGETQSVKPDEASDDAEEPAGGEPPATSSAGGVPGASAAFDAPADLIIDAVNDARTLRAAAPPPPGYALYLVRSGDTLSGIALAHGVSLARLLEVNDLTPATLIYPGNELRIPVGTDQGTLDRAISGAVPDAGDALPYIPIEAPFDAISGVAYGTIRDQRNGAIHSAALTINSEGARLVLACSEGQLVAFVRLPSALPVPSADGRSSLGVYYHLDDGRLRGNRWRSGGGRLLVAPDAAGLVAELSGSGRISLRIGSGAESVNFAFAIADLLATPIQPNLARCGAPAPP